MLNISNALVIKTFTFDSSHMLESYKGKCSNLHGHTYKLEVQLFHPSKDIPEDGMVVDFNIMKENIGELVKLYDHAYLYNSNANQEARVADLLESMHKKTLSFDVPTTCENLAKSFYDTLTEEGMFIYSITLYETPTSYCHYLRSDWEEYQCPKKK